MKRQGAVILATVLGAAAAAAQPAADDPPAQSPPPAAQPGPNTDLVPPDTGLPRDTVPEAPIEPGARKRRRPRVVHPPLDFPEVLRIPTGWLLPAAVLYSASSIDTGGGVTSDSRVGLGDVAEFGVATTDQVRERELPGDKPERIQPYLVASFRLGIAERRLFDAQPGVTLGFRKSFERNHGGHKTRVAELTLVASKHLGSRVALHLGGAVWDASLQSTGEVPGEATPPEITLHGHGYRRQIRVLGGFEARPLARSSILIDVGWAPEFCYRCTSDPDKIRLRPELSWGVRYDVARFLQIESGVRVPDIGNVNLLDAQIFGQLTLTSYALRAAVDSLK